MVQQDLDRLRGQSRKFQKSTLRTAGVTGALATLQGQLDAAGDIPVTDPGLEAQAISAARRSSGEAFRTRAAATGGGLGAAGASAGLFQVGATNATAGVALTSRRTTSLLRRFQLQRDVANQIAQTSQAGISASPAGAIIQADAQLQAAQIAADAQRRSQMLGLGASLLGGLVSGGAGVLGASILSGGSDG